MELCILIFSLTVWIATAQVSNFVIQPTTVPQIATYNSNVTYNCAVDSIDVTVDLLAKTPDSERYVPIHTILNVFDETSFISNRSVCLHTVDIPIYENGIPNNTKVRCRYRTRSEGSQTGDNIGTIIIQGALSAVALRAQCSIHQERNVNVIWKAPYSLNVTDSSHSIRYRVQTSHDSYTLTAGNESITVPANLSDDITVTPYNGPEDNPIYGNSSSITIITCQGLPIAAENVNISAHFIEELGKLYFVFSLPEIPENCVICRNHSYINATHTTSPTFTIDDEYTDFYSNIAVLNVTNSSTSPLKFGRTYNLTIHIEHSTGGSNTTGDLFIRISKDIVSVGVEKEVDHLAVTTIFTSSSDASGAHTVLNNTDPSKGSCRDGLQVLNPEKFGTKAVANYAGSHLPQGTYSLNVFALNSSGLLPENLQTYFAYPHPISWKKNSMPVMDYTPANISVSYEPSNSQIVAKCNATCTGAVVVLQEVDDNDIILFNDSIVSSLSNQQAIFTGIEEGNEYCISIYFLHNGSMIGATRESSTVDTKVPSKTEPIKLEIVVPITIIITIIIITLSIALIVFLCKKKKHRVHNIDEKSSDVTPSSSEVVLAVIATNDKTEGRSGNPESADRPKDLTMHGGSDQNDTLLTPRDINFQEKANNGITLEEL